MASMFPVGTPSCGLYWALVGGVVWSIVPGRYVSLVTLRVKGVSSVDVDAAAWFVYRWGICLCQLGRLLVALGMMTPVLKHAGLYC